MTTTGKPWSLSEMAPSPLPRMSDEEVLEFARQILRERAASLSEMAHRIARVGGSDAGPMMAAGIKTAATDLDAYADLRLEQYNLDEWKEEHR